MTDLIQTALLKAWDWSKKTGFECGGWIEKDGSVHEVFGKERNAMFYPLEFSDSSRDGLVDVAYHVHPNNDHSFSNDDLVCFLCNRMDRQYVITENKRVYVVRRNEKTPQYSMETAQYYAVRAMVTNVLRQNDLLKDTFEDREKFNRLCAVRYRYEYGEITL